MIEQFDLKTKLELRHECETILHEEWRDLMVEVQLRCGKFNLDFRIYLVDRTGYREWRDDFGASQTHSIKCASTFQVFAAYQVDCRIKIKDGNRDGNG